MHLGWVVGGAAAVIAAASHIVVAIATSSAVRVTTMNTYSVRFNYHLSSLVKFENIAFDLA